MPGPLGRYTEAPVHDHAGIIRGDWKGGLGPGKKTLIEGFKGLSPLTGPLR